MIEVTAKVYLNRREKSNASKRAVITSGPFKGLKVSCSRAIRDGWQIGQTIKARGRVVATGDYFKASEVKSCNR